MDANDEHGKAVDANSAASSAQKASADLPKVDAPALAPDQSETARNSADVASEGHRLSTAVALYKGAQTGETPEAEPALASRQRLWSKFNLPPLAAVIVLTLGVGALAGSLGTYGVNHWLAAAPATKQASEVTKLNETFAKLSADVASLKAAQAAAVKTTGSQVTRLTERLEKAEKAQSEPAARIAKITETVDRLERRIATAPAALAPAAPAPATTTPANQGDITGSIPMPRAAPAAANKDISRLPVIQNWILQRVVDGTAVILSRDGVIEVGIGDALPGGGRVEDIRRQDGRWIVVTSRGLVVTR